jgi:predicted ATPase
VNLLSKRPEDRPASAREVLSALASIHDRVTAGQDEAAAATSPAHAATPELNILDRIVRGRLVGREREMAETTAFWKQALDGQSHVLLISGEPGIGKSRLARELVTLAEVSRAVVLKGECYAEGGAPYAPIAQFIRTPLQNPAWANNAEALGLPDYVLADLVTLSPDLRARYPALPPNPPLDPQSEQQRLFESVATATAALAEHAPVLLVLEDAHWADSGTLFLLRHLARRMQGRRLLMVLTYREVEIDEACCLPDVLHDLNRERLATRLKLTRLTRAQTQKLLEVMFGEDIAPELLDSLYRETEGNPFFLEEVCKALLEDGQIYFADGRWQRPAVSELRIPQSVRVTIHARLSKLPAPAQEALRLAAVLGREFDFDTLHTACGLSEEVLIDALESATRAQIIEEARANGHGLTFAFAHALIPSTLRESMSGPRLRVLHRRAGAAIEQRRPDDFEGLAYHAGQAGDDQRASHYYHRAGDRALARYANQEAERHYRTALDLNEDAEARAKMFAGLGEALFRLSRYAEAERAWREAIALHQRLSNYDEAARLYGRAVRAVWYQEDAPRSLALAREGLAAAAGQPETPGLAALLHEAGRACFFNKLKAEAHDLCGQALALAERLNLVDVQAETLTTIGILPSESAGEAQRALRRAIELAESAQLLMTAARAHFNLAGQLQDAGDPRGARDHFVRARQLARQMGMAAWEMDYLSHSLNLSLNLGDLDVVEAELPGLRELQKSAIPSYWAAQMPRLLEAVLFYYRGDFARALEILRLSQTELLQQNDRKFIHEVHGVIIQVELSQNHFEAAERLVEETLALNTEDEANEVFFHAMLCLARVGQGRLAEAQAAWETARQLIGDEKHLFKEGVLRWAEARLRAAERRWPEAMAAFDQTLQIVQRVGWRWYTARIECEWAEVYLARGEPGDHERAVVLLTEALSEFGAMRIPYFATQTRERLNAISQATQAPAPISGD